MSFAPTTKQKGARLLANGLDRVCNEVVDLLAFALIEPVDYVEKGSLYKVHSQVR